MQLADRRDDVVEIGLHDLRLERGQNKISCSAGAAPVNWGKASQPTQPIYTFSGMVDNTNWTMVE
jgi:hypothetical protein